MDSLVKELSITLRINKLKLVTAESCTGGMIASAITDLAGSSDIFDRGFVTYSNESKIAMLGVSPATLQSFGAVSEQTAAEMVVGALKNSLADVAIAVTGIAGPTGGTEDKPVGLVFIGIGKRNEFPHVTRYIFGCDRTSVRRQTTITAMQNLLDIL